MLAGIGPELLAFPVTTTVNSNCSQSVVVTYRAKPPHTKPGQGRERVVIGGFVPGSKGFDLLLLGVYEGKQLN